jgi:hypothetical protein
VWPEYGGEQLNGILQKRAVPDAWRTRLVEADGWLLFLRLNKLRVYEDVSLRPAAVAPPDRSRAGADGWDANAQVVELLQILLATAGRGLAHPLGAPRLAILLSCWDELKAQDTPNALLRRRLPLVASFVETNWAPEARSVWGLSSLERPLHRDKPDEDFINAGPEQFGYVVEPDGWEPLPDLTLPLARLCGAR